MNVMFFKLFVKNEVVNLTNDCKFNKKNNI